MGKRPGAWILWNGNFSQLDGCERGLSFYDHSGKSGSWWPKLLTAPKSVLLCVIWLPGFYLFRIKKNTPLKSKETNMVQRYRFQAILLVGYLIPSIAYALPLPAFKISSHALYTCTSLAAVQKKGGNYSTNSRNSYQDKIRKKITIGDLKKQLINNPEIGGSSNEQNQRKKSRRTRKRTKIPNKNTYTLPSVKSHTKKQMKVTGRIQKILSIARVPPLSRQRE